MRVKHEIKSQLAKLLATEDLIVEHKKVETAQFNVHTRVLILPLWEKASNIVYDMLVGHEVGHALFTPDRDWSVDYKIHPSVVNIVEDSRIEKLMKRRYAGLAKSFYYGYEELNNDDFFSIGDEDLDTFSFADRVNLHYKVGNFIDLAFSPSEEQIIGIIDKCETFDDVLEAAQMVDDRCQEEIKEREQEKEENKDGISGGVAQTSEMTDDERAEMMLDECLHNAGMKEDSPFDEKSDQPTDAPPKTQGGESSGDIDVKTVDTLAESLKDLTSEHAVENAYVEIPKVKLDQFIVSNDEIHQHCQESWDPSNVDPNKSEYYQFEFNKYDFSYPDSQFEDFKNSAMKEVNYLVKEFECRKAASSYARSATSRTGVLDTAKLHTYRYNEDLFKKITVLPDGKNHGLIFILDWSGSMNLVMLDIIKQLYNLIWFCRKVQIPFEVYAFTNDYPFEQFDSDGNRRLSRIYPYEKKPGLLVVQEHFSLMNILTSKVNAKVLDQQMKNIFRIAFSFTNRFVCYDIPCKLRLSGTPLNESMIALHEIIPQFKSSNKVEKVQCIVLTDGEGCAVPYHKLVKRSWEKKEFLGWANVNSNVFLRDRKTGNTYAFDNGWYGMTDVLLRNLRDKFPEVNFIGMRLLANRDGGYFIRNYCGSYGKLYDETMRDWRRNKSFTIKNSGYHSYFGLSAKSLAEEVDFEVKEDATKSQIKSAFIKSLKGKKVNKKILSEFIELVA